MNGLDILGLISDMLPQVQAQMQGMNPVAATAAPVSDPYTTELPYQPNLSSAAILRNLPAAPISDISPSAAQTPLAAIPLPSSIMPGETAGMPTGMSLPGTPSISQYGGYNRGRGRSRTAPRIPPAPRPQRPGRVSGNSGIDLTHLDLGELLFLVLHPQGPQILSLMSQAQQQKRQEAFQQQQMMLQQAQMERQNQIQDLNTKLTMQQMGGVEVPAGVQGDVQAAFLHGQKIIDTPAGRFTLPTPQKQAERAQTAYQAQEEAKAQAAARAEAVKAAVKAKYEPAVPLAPEFIDFFHLGWTRELPLSVVDSMVKQYNARKPQNEHVSVISNNNGTVSVVRAGVKGTSVETVPGGPTKTPAAVSAAGAMTASGRMTIAREFEAAKREAGDTSTAYNRLIEAKNNGDMSVTDAMIQQAKDKADSARNAFHATLERAKAAGWQMDSSGVGINYGVAPSGVSGASSPALDQSLQLRNFALQKYRTQYRGTPQEAAYKKWFTDTFKVDPDTLP